jgi:hypothetical protein
VVLLAGIIAGSRAVDAVRAWVEWRRAVAIDPSAADAYRSFCIVDTTVALLSLCIAVLVWWLLRPRPARLP